MGNSILKSNFKKLHGEKRKKFSRSYPCLGKKDSAKHKQNLTLIEESSEEDENHSKLPVYNNSNGVKKNGHNSVQAEYTNHQGHYRQLSRDRQLPPVPDADDFHMSHPFRQSSFKLKHKSCESTNFSVKDLPRQNTEDYGTIIDSETYGEARSNAQSPFSAPLLSFKMMPTDDMKDVDPLYAIVIPQQQRRTESKDDPVGVFSHGDHDSFLIQHLNDHGYSIIIKKTPLNEFSSLRKPDRSKAMSREQCHQSLQSLSNQAPGLPVRLYKESDIFHLRNDIRRPHAAPHEPEPRIRDPSKSSRCSSSSIRRFSQPLVPGGTALHDECSGNEIDEPDVLRSLQSCFNTPPIKRASLGDLCVSTHRCLDNDELSIAAEVAPITMDAQEPSRDDVSDLYRRITVRESLASLRERNALPTESAPVEVSPAPLQHVYEGFYETLYYSSADNSGRGAGGGGAGGLGSGGGGGGGGGGALQQHVHQHTNHHASPEPENSPRVSPRTQSPAAPHRQPSQERMVYLGLDNYLSITENPIGPHTLFPGPTLPNTVARRGSGADGAAGPANQRQERSSVVYTATGSEIYAEISDVYLSKQYEELPEPRQVHRSDCGGGQVNNGFIECSSPGSVRVMLEIQSFRHMDSDVDISSRCTTPLHPFGKSVAVPGTSRAYGSHFPDPSSSCASSLMVRHPWYLPQKSGTVVPLCVSEGASTPASSSSSANKAPQNSLVVMTPLMERSMEDASAFAFPDDDRAQQVALDFGNSVPGVAVRAHDSTRDVLSSLQAARRILYPPFNCSSEAL